MNQAIRPWFLVGLLFCSLEGQARPLGVLPVPNKQPLTPDSFCSGAQNTLKTARLDLVQQLSVLCTGNLASPFFKTLLTSPYKGVGNPSLTHVMPPREDANAKTTEIQVAFVMRVPKTAVNTLLYEEKQAIVAYDSEAQPKPLGGQLANMRMSFAFTEPPKNEGDADTTFAIQQTVEVRSAAVTFTDVSRHDLRQYILHPDNFDFFLAGRTLVTPTEQFKKSVVLRGFFTDAEDVNASFVVTVAHFLMHSRDQHEQLVRVFSNFLTTDVSKLYQAHSKP